MVSKENTKTSMTYYINKMFNHSFKKEWYETYWAIDIHGTVLNPDYRKEELSFIYYPYAKEVLQMMTKREDIVLIMATSSYPHEIEFYVEQFGKDNIIFEYINENPKIKSNLGNFGYYEDKYYFNVMFEDKSGFNPDLEWEAIYNLLKEYEEGNNIPNPEWLTKF